MATISVQPRRAPEVVGLNFQTPGSFKPSELTAERPALLRDYIDEHHATDVGIHLRQDFLRVALQAEVGVIPCVG